MENSIKILTLGDWIRSNFALLPFGHRLIVQKNESRFFEVMDSLKRVIRDEEGDWWQWKADKSPVIRATWHDCWEKITEYDVYNIETEDLIYDQLYNDGQTRRLLSTEAPPQE